MISLVKTSKHLLFAAALLTVFFAAGNVTAAKMTNNVMLDGTHEVPPNSSMASGSGSVMVDADKSVSGSVSTKGIEGTVAHIHEAAAGKNGPVIIKLNKSGADVWTVPAGSKLTDEQFASYKAGNLYVNVHSAAIPGGEIRGQLVPN